MVSIIVPCYNLGVFLKEALDSVLAQSYMDWECIVVDDGSTDNSVEVASHFVEADRRFKLLKQANLGVVMARNHGVAASKGEFLLFLDADDVLMPNYMEKAMRLFAEHPRLRVIGGQAEQFGKGVWREIMSLPPFSMEQMLARNCLYVTSFVRRTDFDRVGGFSMAFKGGWEDWDFWLSVLDDNDQALVLDEVVFRYRLRSESRNHFSNVQISQMRRVLWERHKELFSRFYFDPTLTPECEQARYYLKKYSRLPGVRLYRFASKAIRSLLCRK